MTPPHMQVVETLKHDQQAMVFVHARKETGRAARMLQLKAQQLQQAALFDCSQHPKYALFQKDVSKSRNKYEEGACTHSAA